MKESSYIIIRAEVDNVKVITKKTNNEEALEILNKGEVIILNIFDNIVNFKVQGRARIVSNLDQVISEYKKFAEIFLRTFYYFTRIVICLLHLVCSLELP